MKLPSRPLDEPNDERNYISVTLYTGSRRGCRADSEQTRLTVDYPSPRKFERTAYNNPPADVFCARVRDVRASGVEVINRNVDAQSKLTVTFFTCNLLQIFRWMVRERDLFSRRCSSDDTVYETIGPSFSDDATKSDACCNDDDDDDTLPLDYYAELFDADAIRLPANVPYVRLARNRRHAMYGEFWKRGGDIAQLCNGDSLIFRRRLQYVDVTTPTLRVNTISLDMQLPLVEQLYPLVDNSYGRQFTLFGVRFIVRHSKLVGESLRTCLLRQFRASLVAAFVPWDEYHAIEMRVDVLGSRPRPIVDKQPDTVALNEVCWPSYETRDRAIQTLATIGELVFLTDESPNKLRTREFREKFGRPLAHNAMQRDDYPQLNQHVDRFAAANLDLVLQKLLSNRTLWGRLVEISATNSKHPRSVCMYVATVARATRDHWTRETARQFWCSVDQQHALSSIVYLGQTFANSASSSSSSGQTQFALFAVAGRRVRCLPYKPAEKRFPESCTLKLEKCTTPSSNADSLCAPVFDARLVTSSKTFSSRELNRRGRFRRCKIVYHVDVVACDDAQQLDHAQCRATLHCRPGAEPQERAVCCRMQQLRPENETLNAPMQRAAEYLLQSAVAAHVTAALWKSTSGSSSALSRSPVGDQRERGARLRSSQYLVNLSIACRTIVQLLQRCRNARPSTGHATVSPLPPSPASTADNSRVKTVGDRAVEELAYELTMFERDLHTFSELSPGDGATLKVRVAARAKRMLQLIVQSSDMLLETGFHDEYRHLAHLLNNIAP